MSYVKALKKAAAYSGLLLALSILNFWAIDFYSCILALLTFLMMATDDAGKVFLDTTNQPQTVKIIFGAIVKPLSAFFSLYSLFYVFAGESHWLFWSGAGFIALIIFAIEVSPSSSLAAKPGGDANS